MGPNPDHGCQCGHVPVGEWPDSIARSECPMHGVRITQTDHEKAAEIVSREYDTPSHLAHAIAAAISFERDVALVQVKRDREQPRIGIILEDDAHAIVSWTDGDFPLGEVIPFQRIYTR